MECSDGSSYGAENAVLSTIHIKHLAGMPPKEAFGDDFLERSRDVEGGHYLICDPLRFERACEIPSGGWHNFFGRVRHDGNSGTRLAHFL